LAEEVFGESDYDDDDITAQAALRCDRERRHAGECFTVIYIRAARSVAPSAAEIRKTKTDT
jgi:hypothetical protein